MPDLLTTKRCRECGGSIRVSLTSPYHGEEKETGCSASAWADQFDTHFVGWICLDCAFKLATVTDRVARRGSLSFPDPDFIYDVGAYDAPHQDPEDTFRHLDDDECPECGGSGGDCGEPCGYCDGEGVL